MYLASHKRDIGKQSRPRSAAAALIRVYTVCIQEVIFEIESK